MSLKCERCGKIDWGSTARVYFMQHAVVLEVCAKCEDAFKDLDWPDAILERMEIAAFRYARLKESPDADEARALEIIRDARQAREEARTKVKEWLSAGVAALLLFVLAAPAHAEEDPLRIAGGPRQLADAAHCSAYRPVWPELDRAVPSIPAVYEYGPEALIPTAPRDNTSDPIATEAVWLWGDFASLNALYTGRQPIGGGGLPAAIGYDQLEAAYKVAAEGAPGGPRLRMPRYPREWTERTYRLHVEVWVLSWSRRYSQDQLDRMLEVLLRTPTCGGVVY